MSCDILEGDKGACFFRNMISFGPIFKDYDEARKFEEWMACDLSGLTPLVLQESYERWKLL